MAQPKFIVKFDPGVDSDPISTGAWGIVRGTTITVNGAARGMSLSRKMKSPKVSDLQAVLQHLVDRDGILAYDETTRWSLSAALKPERNGQTYGSPNRRLVSIFQQQPVEVSASCGYTAGEVTPAEAGAQTSGITNRPYWPDR